MPYLINKTEAMIIVHGAESYDIAPGLSVEVDSETKWEDHPYVKCGALALGELDASQADDAGSLEALQREYKDITGKDAAKSWNAEKLEEKINEALDAQ